ncbi:hypothetical protein K492DRAFT_125860 [Lichtheimia hyalospora FSU 10163]|nr:hypothetical protein K492DRAFT_125860 [Lichtheimia hyalospora FSU 10163]
MAQNPFDDPVTHNAWQQQESSAPSNAYQDDEMNAWQGGGGGGGDSGKHLSSYSRIATHESANKPNAMHTQDGASATTPVAHTGRPSAKRLGIRVAQLVAAIGHLGFAAGASPFSNHDVPFSDKSCFYFLWAVVSAPCYP